MAVAIKKPGEVATSPQPDILRNDQTQVIEIHPKNQPFVVRHLAERYRLSLYHAAVLAQHMGMALGVSP